MRIYVDKDKRRIIVEIQRPHQTTPMVEEELTFTEAYKLRLQLDAALEELVDEVANG